MKRIRKSRSARILSWMLTVAMITPLIGGFIAPISAKAQAGSSTGGVQTVIVLDFANKSGTGGAALARLATDEVAVALANSARFEVLKRDEVIRTANELGMKPPYDQNARLKLAAQLGAASIVDGTVEFVKEDAKHMPRTVQVGLSIRISEANTGDLLSGAAQIGEARSRAGQSDTGSLTQEATGNAATQGVRQILGYTLPEGTVLSTVGDVKSLQVLINRGSRDGVQEGMEMIVTRDKQRVARIRVGSVFPADAEASVIDNILGIRPEDKVRAVFPMPVFDTHGSIRERRVTRASNPVSALGKILLVLLVGIVVAVAANGGSTSVTGVTAEADTVNSGPAVQIVWRDSMFGSGQTLEYHVWRSPDLAFGFTSPLPVAAVSGGVRNYTDFPAPFSPWRGQSFNQPGPPQNNAGGNNGGNAATVTPTAGTVTGFRTTGAQVTYQITAVLRRPVVTQNAGGGGGGGGGQNQGGTEDIETGVVTSQPATPLDQAVLNAPSNNPPAANININSITFNFSNPTGADTFQVELSTDPTFKNRNLIAIFPVGIPSTSLTLTGISGNGALRNNPTFLAFVNTTTTTSPRVFWRVGARRDSDRPGPVDFITRNHTVSDRTFRLIYSNPSSFTFAPLPPGPP